VSNEVVLLANEQTIHVEPPHERARSPALALGVAYPQALKVRVFEDTASG